MVKATQAATKRRYTAAFGINMIIKCIRKDVRCFPMAALREALPKRDWIELNSQFILYGK